MFIKDHDTLCEQKMTSMVGHQQGQVMKELFVPLAENGARTSHLRWRALIAQNWHGDAAAHELCFSLGEFVRLLDEAWLQIQRLYPSQDWKAIRAPEHWEDLQHQIDSELQ